MPYTRKQKALFRMCSTDKGRKKARVKCPPKKTARKLLKHK